MEAHKIRHASEHEKQLLIDLTSKCTNDIHKALELTLPLVAEDLGPAGIYAMMQKVLCTLAFGTAMGFTAIRFPNDLETLKAKLGEQDGEHRFDDDDLLFCCLIAYAAEHCRQEKKKGAVEEAQALFVKLKGYAPNKPVGW